MIKTKKDVQQYLRKHFIINSHDQIWVHDEQGFYIENGYGRVGISEAWMASVVWNFRKHINEVEKEVEIEENFNSIK